MELEQALIELIDKRIDERLDELRDESDWWGMNDFREYLGNKSRNWVVDHITTPNKDELDANNGGFVHYPRKRGDRFRMDARKMKTWLHDNPDKVI